VGDGFGSQSLNVENGMRSSRSVPGIWVGQRGHFVCLSILLGLVFSGWRFLGEPFPETFWLAVAVPVVHQVFVWLAWRVQLKRSASGGSISFFGYVTSFFILFFGRFVSLGVLAWIDRGSLGLGSSLRVAVTVLCSVLGIYAMYSVAKYFGMNRAAGGDHFDSRYRNLPPVKEGIFRFTSNGMYVYAFLLFWAIAIGFNSSAALVVAAYSHAYIWVHFYATERPDMKYLYSSG